TAQQIFASTRTPAEKLHEDWEEAQALFEQGLLDDETLERQFLKVQEGFAKLREEAAKPAVDAENRLMDEAARITQSMMSPAEKFRQEIEKLIELSDAGFLDP